jgi:hypothetical protein
MLGEVAKSMRDEDHGLARACLAKVLEQFILARRVHRRARLVYNDESHSLAVDTEKSARPETNQHAWG